MEENENRPPSSYQVSYIDSTRGALNLLLNTSYQVKHPSQKRKRSPVSEDEEEQRNDDEDGELSDPISSETDEDDDDEPTFAPRGKATAKTNGKAKGTKAPAAKRARLTPKPGKSGPAKPRKAKANIDASAVAKEAAITDDNALFSEPRRV